MTDPDGVVVLPPWQANTPAMDAAYTLLCDGEDAGDELPASPGESWRDRLARVACEGGGAWVG